MVKLLGKFRKGDDVKYVGPEVSHLPGVRDGMTGIVSQVIDKNIAVILWPNKIAYGEKRYEEKWLSVMKPRASLNFANANNTTIDELVENFGYKLGEKTDGKTF